MADSVPAFDDIPAFDDLPAGGASAAGVPRFDDIPSFDDLPDGPAQRPAPEGAFMSGVREAAHSVIPAAAGLVGAGAGGVVGAVAGPVGSVGGALGGMVAASMGADKLQHMALDAFGFNDDEQRAANAEANPKSAFVGGLAPALATMSPVAGARVGTRALGAGLMGGFEAGQEYINEGTVDPTKTAIAAAAGAVFPAANRVGEKLMGAGGKMVPGRPNRPANPAADQAHVDVGDPQAEQAVGDSSLAEAAPTPAGVTTGNPQSAPQRSARTYPKGQDPKEQGRYAEALSDPEAMRQFAHEEGLTEQQAREIAEANYEPPAEGAMTQGQMDPATEAALTAANPAPAAAAPPPAPPRAPRAKKLTGTARENPDGSISSGDGASSVVFQQPPKETATAVETGIPQPGEPLAVGENEAAAMPQRAMPELKGETPLNDSITPAQKVAGNYPKARTHDFGKPVKVETHEGDMRRSHPDAPVQWENKAPGDYGYFGKTQGADGDPIDFYRPKAGSPDLGDKHFIIDQKDAETGKFDEHKVMTYYKDLDAAREAYTRGFSDDKALARLHDITEVSRGDLVKWLAKATSRPAREPYGDPMPKQPKAAKDRAVVQDLIGKLKAAGKTEEVAKIEAMPDAQLAKAVEGKRTRKYGIGTGDSAGYQVEGIVNAEGKPVTANTKAKAAERSAAHKAVSDWFENSKPPADTESNGALLDRLKGHSYPSAPGAWAPTFKPREWLLSREAKNVLSKPTPKNIEKFREAERMLRGSDEDVQNYRGGNRLEADIARSKRSGDTAVNNAENKLVQPGVNSAEDAMIEAIDKKRGGSYWDGLAERTFDRVGIPKKDRPKFDVPHEEAESMVEPTPVKTKADLKKLPHKTVDVGSSPLAIDTKAISKDVMAKADARKAEAAKLAGKKAVEGNVASEDKKAAEGRQIKVTDPKELQRLIEASNKAAQKKLGMDALPAEAEPKMSKPVQDLYDHFVNDERGSLDINKIKRDFMAALKRTEPKTYIAKKSGGAKDDYIRSVGEDLHRIAQIDKNHFIGILEKASKDWPKELDEAARERIYHARDADSAHFDLPGKQPGKTNIESLPPDLKALYDQHFKPVLDQNDQFVANIRARDPDRIGEDVLHHISRITKGETDQYNMLKHDDPTSPQYNGLSVNANAAKSRKFFALVRASDGRRFVVQPTDTGYLLWQNGKQIKIKDPAFKFADGGKYTVKPTKGGAPVDYTMRQSTTNEIETHARGMDKAKGPIRYFKDAGFSAYVANAQLGSMARHLMELERIRGTDEFKKLSTTNPNSRKIKELGYAEPNMPNFKGTFVHPDLKAVFDDFAGHPQGWYRQLNSAVTKLLFWMPTAHIANVATHAFVGRGWDNFSIPKNVRMVVQHIPRAIKSVVNQDALQMELRRNGVGTIYGSVITKDMMTQIGKAFRQEIERNPSQWGPIADKLGVPLHDMGSAVYRGSSKVMWAANDMILTARILELQAKGTSMRQAIIEAERDIPNYRIPTKIIGSGEKGRTAAEFLGDPSKTSFGRYHYGMFNSYANIVKDAIGKDATMGDRLDAVGKLMSMGLLGLVLYPAADKAQKLLTGNEDASQQRRGPLSVPSHLIGAALGKEDIASAARSTITVPPLISTAAETLFNKDFRGKSIVEPGDVRAAVTQGSGVAAGRVLLQEAEHAARGLVSPYSTLSNAAKKAGPEDTGLAGAAKVTGRAIRDQALDAKDPSAKASKYERMVPIKTERDARTRFRQGGSGPGEGIYNKVFGYK